MKEDLKNHHEKMANNFNIPNWAKIKCPDCKKTLPDRCTRRISICLNSRKFGDLAVEYCCDQCEIMNTVYFNEKIDTLKEFLSYFPNKSTRCKPVEEEVMYKKMYNNLLENYNKERKNNGDD